MKSVGKILAAALGVLIILCVLCGLALGFSEKGQGIVRFTTDLFKVTRTAKGVESLAKKFPFTPPQDGNVPEDRLLVYISVCKQMKPSVTAYEEWIQVHEGQRGDFKDAQAAIKLTADVMEGTTKAMEQNQMGPGEFGWIDRALSKAAKEQASSGSQLERDLLKAYSQVLSFPELTREERERVSQDLSRFGEKLGEPGGTVLSQNAELYRKYSAQLKECELGEFGRQLLQGFMQGGRPRHRRVEAEKQK